MSTRYLIAALLMTSACVAHADVTTSTPAPSGFLSSWTTGNGTSVIGSGVLSDNASLIGGVAHGSDAGLTQALYQKASANAAQTNGVVKISYSQGIEGDFLTRTSNAVLVAMLGDSLSAVSSPDGAIITTASQASSNVGAGGGHGGSVPVSSGAGVTAPSQSAGTNTGANTNTDANTDSGLLTSSDSLPPASTGNQPLAIGAADQQVGADLPEPSSIALLTAGLFGAVGLRRRAKR
jgi:hypothetical protein